MIQYVSGVFRTIDRTHFKRILHRVFLLSLPAFCVVAIWLILGPTTNPFASALPPDTGALNYVVDRLEGVWAVLVEENRAENSVVVPASSLPDESGEGTLVALSVLPNPLRQTTQEGGTRSYAFVLDFNEQRVTCQVSGYATELPRSLFRTEVHKGSLITLLFQQQAPASSPEMLVAARRALEMQCFPDGIVDLTDWDVIKNAQGSICDPGGEGETSGPSKKKRKKGGFANSTERQNDKT